VLGTVFHTAETVAFLGTVEADIRTFGAKMLVMGRTNQHGVRGGAACLGACHHQLHVLRFRVFAAKFDTLARAHGQTDLVA
jgi:hypothetical protein